MVAVGICLVGLGLLAVLVGLAGSLLPALPGPPISAIGPLLVQLGVWAITGVASPWGWALVAVGLVLGAAATVVELSAPLLARRVATSNRGATLGAYYGLFIGLLGAGSFGVVGAGGSLVSFGITLVISTVLAMGLLIAGPFAGAFVGQLAAQPDPTSAAVLEWVEDPWKPEDGVFPLIREAALSGAAQVFSLLLTTVAKVTYCSLAGVLAVVIGLLALL